MFLFSHPTVAWTQIEWSNTWRQFHDLIIFIGKHDVYRHRAFSGPCSCLVSFTARAERMDLNMNLTFLLLPLQLCKLGRSVQISHFNMLSAPLRQRTHKQWNNIFCCWSDKSFLFYHTHYLVSDSKHNYFPICIVWVRYFVRHTSLSPCRLDDNKTWCKDKFIFKMFIYKKLFILSPWAFLNSGGRHCGGWVIGGQLSHVW